MLLFLPYRLSDLSIQVKSMSNLNPDWLSQNGVSREAGERAGLGGINQHLPNDQALIAAQQAQREIDRESHARGVRAASGSSGYLSFRSVFKGLLVVLLLIFMLMLAVVFYPFLLLLF